MLGASLQGTVKAILHIDDNYASFPCTAYVSYICKYACICDLVWIYIWQLMIVLSLQPLLLLLLGRNTELFAHLYSASLMCTCYLLFILTRSQGISLNSLNVFLGVKSSKDLTEGYTNTKLHQSSFSSLSFLKQKLCVGLNEKCPQQIQAFEYLDCCPRWHWREMVV